MKRIQYILLFCVAFVFTTKAQVERVTVSGSVKNKKGNPLPYAHILDLNTHLATLTNSSGYFLFDVNGNDSLKISYIGYKSFILNLSSLPIDSLSRLNVLLEKDTVVLKKTEIYPFPATYAQFKRAFINLHVPDTTPKVNLHLEKALPFINFDYGYPDIAGIKIIRLSPISMLYNKFSHRVKMRRKYLGLLEHDRLRKIAAERLTGELITRATGLTDEDDINDFKEYCNLSTDFIISATDYELYAAILDCFEEFSAEKN